MPTGAMVGASLGSGVLGAVGASKAANAQKDAANQAAQTQLGMFNTVRGDLSPFVNYGASATPALQALLGIGTGAQQAAGSTDWNAYLQQYPDAAAWVQGKLAQDPTASVADLAQQHYTMDGSRRTLPTVSADQAAPGAGVQAALENLPGYQFTRDQGMKAVTNSLAARGLGGASGAYGKGLARFVTGLADSTYNSQVQNLQNAATTGANAAAQTGQLGANLATGAAGNMVGAGNASAAGNLGVAGQLGNSLIGAASPYYAQQFAGMYGNSGQPGGSTDWAGRPISANSSYIEGF